MKGLRTDAGEWINAEAVLYVHPTAPYGIEAVLKYGERIKWEFSDKEGRDKTLNQIIDALTTL